MRKAVVAAACALSFAGGGATVAGSQVIKNSGDDPNAIADGWLACALPDRLGEWPSVAVAWDRVPTYMRTLSRRDMESIGADEGLYGCVVGYTDNSSMRFIAAEDTPCGNRSRLPLQIRVPAALFAKK